MCGAPRGCTTAVALRQRAHQRAGAAGMIEVHVGEEQEVHRVARDAELVERGEYQRNGGVGAGIDDGGPDRPTTTMCEASICGRTYSVSTAVMPSANFVRRGMTAFMALSRATYQHERKLLLTTVMVVRGRLAAHARRRRTRQPGARQHSAGRHAAHRAARGLPELARREFRRLAAGRRHADRHALRRRRAAASRCDAARRARTAHVLPRAGDRGARRRNRRWRPASCSCRTRAATRTRRSTTTT